MVRCRWVNVIFRNFRHSAVCWVMLLRGDLGKQDGICEATSSAIPPHSRQRQFSSIRSDFMKPIGRTIEPHFEWTRGFPLRFLAEHSAVSERILLFFGELRRNKRKWIIAYPEAGQKALIDVGWWWRYRIVVTLEFYAILGEGVGIPKFWWIGSQNTTRNWKNINFEVQWRERNHRIG